MSIAESVAAGKGVLRGHKITEDWWRRFLKCHHDLSLRRGDITAHIRMNVFNRDTMKGYFSMRLLLSTTSIQSLPRYIM